MRWRSGVALLAVAGGAALASTLQEGPNPNPSAAEPALAAPPKPAFAVGEPVPLRADRHATHWSPVRRAVVARARPAAGSRAVAPLARRTPERTTMIVPVLGRRRDATGAVWVRVRLPVLPNGTTGWVPRHALGGYATTTARLVVDRRALTATLLRGGRRVLRVPVGIGTHASPTPAGDFLVRNRLTRFRSPFYGPIAFGTSARSETLTDWPGGGFIGIHGTDRPDLIPGRVSHGCIRMRNPDIRRLARLLPIGTPVSIQ